MSRNRPSRRGRVSLTALQAELHREQGRLPVDCVVCGTTLPKGWPHPEHARCRPEDPSTTTTTGRNHP